MTDQQITDHRNATPEPTYNEEKKEWNEEKIVSVLVETQESIDSDVALKTEQDKAMELYKVWEQIYINEGV